MKYIIKNKVWGYFNGYTEQDSVIIPNWSDDQCKLYNFFEEAAEEVDKLNEEFDLTCDHFVIQ